MPRKYSVEFKEKAVHQIIEMVRLESCSLQRAYTEVGELLGVSHHTLRAWYRDSASVRDNSDASGGETMEEELRRLRRENRELKRANGILKTASAFGPDPRKVDTSGVSYAAWVSVADVSASKASGARRLHQECRLRVL